MLRLILDAVVSVPGVSGTLTGMLIPRFTVYLGCSEVSETPAGMVIRHFENTHESTKDMNQRLGSKLPQSCLPEFQALLQSSFRTDEHNQQSSRRAY